MTLRDLKVGQSARIKAVGGEGELRQHFLDMGVIPGAELTLEACSDGRSYGVSDPWI